VQNTSNVYSISFPSVGSYQRHDVLLDVYVHAFVPLIETAISIQPSAPAPQQTHVIRAFKFTHTQTKD
jgi:hypothetical protein